METPSEKGTPSARAPRADHGIDGGDVEAYRRWLTGVSRPAYVRWMLTLFGAMLVGLIGLLGWAGYALSTVKAELRQVQAHVRQIHASGAPLEALSTSGAPARRGGTPTPHDLLGSLCIWTEGTWTCGCRASA